MAIFSSLASFFRRHKRKLIVASTVSVSVYFLINHFVFKKLRDFQKSLQQELFVKEQIKRRFIQTQNDCHSTVLSLLPVLTKPITDHLPIETITNALKLRKSNQQQQQQQSGNAEMSDSLLTADNLLLHSNHSTDVSSSAYLNKSKVELWNDLKIKTISRTLTLIYSISGLLLLTRLQLNILARRSYLESAILMAGGKLDPQQSKSQSQQDQYNDYVIEQAYLSLSWWLLNNGWLQMSQFIEHLVVKKFDSITAKTQLTIFDFQAILAQINEEILTVHHHDFLHLLFPLNYDNLIESLMNTNPQLITEVENPDSNLLKLINETNLLVTNDFFFEVYSSLIFNSTDTLINNLFLALDEENYLLYQQQQQQQHSNEQNSGKITELFDNTTFASGVKKFKLANLLAQLSIQCGVLCDNNNFADYDHHELTGNIYVNVLNDLEELDEFSASIYSNFE